MIAFALSLAFALTAAPATDDIVVTYWEMPDGGTPDNVTWPQEHARAPIAPGTCYQVDKYDREEAEGFIEDGLLYEGEDWPGSDQVGSIEYWFECVPAGGGAPIVNATSDELASTGTNAGRWWPWAAGAGAFGGLLLLARNPERKDQE